MSNLRLEDLMNLIASMGTVHLSRTRFPGAGSPSLVGKPVLWQAELRVPGYRDKYGQPTIRASGRDPLAVMTELYEKAETYFASEEAKAHRQAYERNWREESEAWKSKDEHLRRWSLCPRSEPYPDVRDPQTPSIDSEVFLKG